MTQATRTPSRAQTTATACAHHYRIEPNAKPVSHAVCRHCGHERDFANGLTWEDYGWRAYPQHAETPQAAEVRRMQASRDVQNAFEGVT